MARSVPNDAYILGTNAGEPIPLAVARPLNSYLAALTADTPLTIEMPDDLNLVTLVSNEPFILAIGEEIPVALGTGWVMGTYLGDANVYYDFVLPKTITLQAAAAAVVKINTLTRWANIANEGVYVSS